MKKDEEKFHQLLIGYSGTCGSQNGRKLILGGIW
jgi:hypothetical protein